MLAGVSVDYYARLEQGRERHPSVSVLDALCRALDLDNDARDHLLRLADVVPGSIAPAAGKERVDPSLLAVVDAWPDTPAFVFNRRLDILACNTLAGALYSDFASVDNLARMIFLDPVSTVFFADWRRSAESSVANLQLALGFDTHDASTLALVDELSAGSQAFADLWTGKDARGKTREAKTFVHSAVGSMTLEFNAFDVRSAPGQQLIVYGAEPGSSSDHALKMLGALEATSRVSEAESRG